jgi:hypothetical protein
VIRNQHERCEGEADGFYSSINPELIKASKCNGKSYT